MDFATQLVYSNQRLGDIVHKIEGLDLVVDVPLAGQSFGQLQRNFLHDLQTPAPEAPRMLGRAYQRLSSQNVVDPRGGVRARTVVWIAFLLKEK